LEKGKQQFVHSNSNCVSIAVVQAVTIDGDPTQFKAIGYDMQLTCRYNASPPVAEVLWKKDGTVIARNTSVQINNSRITIPYYSETLIQLKVFNTTSQDAGNYTCEVTNDVGNSSDTTVIVIEGVYYCTKPIIQRVYALKLHS